MNKVLFPSVRLFVLLLQLGLVWSVSGLANERPHVAMRLFTTQVRAGVANIAFELLRVQTNANITSNDLILGHEKKLHLFIFDPALREFRHEHPIFRGSSNGVWVASTQLRVNGDYWAWVQGQLVGDVDDFTASARLDVFGGYPANPMPPLLGDVRTGVDGTSRVTLSNSSVVAGKATMLNVSVTRTDGSQPVITPYLGAPAHIVAVPANGSSLIHVHPMGAPNSSQWMLHTQFPVPGEYRLWVQFVDANILRTIPLSVRVFMRVFMRVFK